MTQEYDGYTLARLFEGEPEPLDATGWHLVPTASGYALFRRKEGKWFLVLHHHAESRKALVDYLIASGVTVGPKPS